MVSFAEGPVAAGPGYWRTNLTMRQLAPLSVSRSLQHPKVVIDADARLVMVVGRPLPGNRNGCKAWEESGAKAAVGKDHDDRRRELSGHRARMHTAPQRLRLARLDQAHNKSHKQVRARVA